MRGHVVIICNTCVDLLSQSLARSLRCYLCLREERTMQPVRHTLWKIDTRYDVLHRPSINNPEFGAGGARCNAGRKELGFVEHISTGLDKTNFSSCGYSE